MSLRHIGYLKYCASFVALIALTSPTIART